MGVRQKKVAGRNILNHLRMNANRKIKIAHVITSVGYGGAGEDTLLTIEGSNKTKYHIDLVIGQEPRKNALKRIEKNNISVIYVHPFHTRYHFIYDLILVLNLFFLFKKNEYDIVHTHMTKAGILGRIAARIARIPVLIHGIHGNSLELSDNKLIHIIKIFLENKIGKFTDAYISVSEKVSEKYLEYKVGETEKYFTVKSGIKLDQFLKVKKEINIEEKRIRLGIKRGDFVIGNAGRLEESKGHKFLFQATKKIIQLRKNQSIKLLLIGEGKYKEKLIEIVKELGIRKNVIFTGYKKNIAELMALMDVFVLTSLREGLPKVLVEAAATGIPSAAFDVDGVSEIIKDGYNGFLVQPKNIEDLTDKIIQYIDDKELMISHGRKGKEFVVDKWSIEEMIQKTEKIYDDLVERKISNIVLE